MEYSNLTVIECTEITDTNSQIIKTVADALKKDLSVNVFLSNTTKEDFIKSLLNSMAEINQDSIESNEDWKKLSNSITELLDKKLFIDDSNKM